MSNLGIWDKLGKTDPAQTKAFNRAGGFKGTAIKPVYTEHKMTEVFGPCGTGWGFTEPQFQTVPGSDGQVAVYCWLSLWYVEGDKRSDLVPGVGGDMVVVKQSNGLRTDDEAFKKAFTDAIGNAMKHIGMSADVHMGRFDDNKYVQERLREEASGDQMPAANDAPTAEVVRLKPGDGADKLYARLVQQLNEAAMVNIATLGKVWADNKTDIKRLPEPRELDLIDLKEALKAKAIAAA